MAIFGLSKLFQRKTLERMLLERLSEPVHLNLLSIPVALFGSTRSKIFFDLLVRQHHAYGLLAAADRARSQGDARVTVTEFYQPHWFPMQAPERLRAALPDNAELILGPIAETVRQFDPKSPIGFVSIDVDYYSSTRDCLSLFARSPQKYQPVVDLYLDDVQWHGHNAWCGEMQAVREFSDAHELRKIARTNFLRENRLFKNAAWIGHFYSLYVLDHPARTTQRKDKAAVILGNPYLDLATVG